MPHSASRARTSHILTKPIGSGNLSLWLQPEFLNESSDYMAILNDKAGSLLGSVGDRLQAAIEKVAPRKILLVHDVDDGPVQGQDYLWLSFCGNHEAQVLAGRLIPIA